MITYTKTVRQWRALIKRSQVIQLTEVRADKIYPMIIRTLENSNDTYTAAIIESHVAGPDVVITWQAREEDFISNETYKLFRYGR